MQLKSDSAETSVKKNLAEVRANTLLREELRNNASGYIFDIKTGLVTEVKA